MPELLHLVQKCGCMMGRIQLHCYKKQIQLIMKKYVVCISLIIFMGSLLAQGPSGVALEGGVKNIQGALNYLGYDLSIGTRIEGSGYHKYTFFDIGLGGGHQFSYWDSYSRSVETTYVSGFLRVGLMGDFQDLGIISRIGLSVSCVVNKPIATELDLPPLYRYEDYTVIVFRGNAHIAFGDICEMIGSLGVQGGKDKNLQIKTRSDQGGYVPVSNASLVPVVGLGVRFLLSRSQLKSHCLF
ncbi:MAG: hypothetical protein ACI83D_000305 [Planctomycetota bacterium]